MQSVTEAENEQKREVGCPCSPASPELTHPTFPAMPKLPAPSHPDHPKHKHEDFRRTKERKRARFSVEKPVIPSLTCFSPDPTFGRKGLFLIKTGHNTFFLAGEHTSQLVTTGDILTGVGTVCQVGESGLAFSKAGRVYFHSYSGEQKEFPGVWLVGTYSLEEINYLIVGFRGTHGTPSTYAVYTEDAKLVRKVELEGMVTSFRNYLIEHLWDEISCCDLSLSSLTWSPKVKLTGTDKGFYFSGNKPWALKGDKLWSMLEGTCKPNPFGHSTPRGSLGNSLIFCEGGEYVLYNFETEEKKQTNFTSLPLDAYDLPIEVENRYRDTSRIFYTEQGGVRRNLWHLYPCDPSVKLLRRDLKKEQESKDYVSSLLLPYLEPKLVEFVFENIF